MGKEHIGKSFKSGNSVAIRIPASIGVEAGREWEVERNPDGRIILKEVDTSRTKISLDGIYGSMRGRGLKRLPIEHVERDWSRPAE
jgi:antitoxin VapB